MKIKIQRIAAGATLLIVTQGLSTASVVTGSAQLSTTGNVSGFAIIQSGGQEAFNPLFRRQSLLTMIARAGAS